MALAGNTSSPLLWTKSSKCLNSNCVEVAATDDSVFVRNSGDPDGPSLCVDRDAWRRFIDVVRSGAMDRPQSTMDAAAADPSTVDSDTARIGGDRTER
jgi:Domain of unknown function (DUF397)